MTPTPTIGNNTGRIPSLDGWRGLSILLVIIGHQIVDGGGNLKSGLIGAILSKWFVWHIYGVQIFFVISGFLITYLLLNEYNTYSAISFKNFYIRRFFRIIPAYCFFLLVVFSLSGFFRHEVITAAIWFKAAFFLINFDFGGGCWTLGHIWSLSVEEQYYLFWPLIFSKTRLRGYIPLMFVCAAPLFRMINYIRPGWIGDNSFLVHADAIFWGALFAMFINSPVLPKFLKYSWLIILMSVVLLVCQKNAVSHTAYLTVPFARTFFSMAVIILIYKSLQEGSVLYRIFNNPLLAFVGSISYSLYLWQQLLYPGSILGESYITRFPINILLMFLLAFISSRVIEKPFLRFRGRYLLKTAA